METQLSEQAYAVLTMVALRGRATAYEIKRGLAHLAREFWSAPHTQVYRECVRLTQLGLLEEEQEATGRRRRVYTLTAKGKAEVTRWVRAPTEASMEIHDVAQLKLMASELSTAEDIRRLAQLQVEIYRGRLALLDKVEAQFGGRPELALRMLGVGLGRTIYQAALAFWSALAANPPAPGDR